MTKKSTQVPHVHKQNVATVSGTVFISIVFGTVTGVIWAFLRPKQEVQLLPDGQMAVISQTVDAGFTGLLWFVGITAICGLVLGNLSHRKRTIDTPGAMLVGVLMAGFIALLCAVVTYIVGQSVAGLLQPDLTGVQPGDEVSIIPNFTTYTALLIAPLISMLVLWTRVLFLGDSGEPGTTAKAEEAVGGNR
ncbi:MAG: hypothetical protein Q4E11_03240 [Corynebacterium sp.]|uniref:hypothetical protein n=1 Tax=Corynebacterium sp. TaxID=1720 RepID=UPI0026DAC848|nr:hypothetical protein [Corynebacterium sp.]MDO5029583.1 hypothetical protein [Corynebacterium sp.]